MANNKKIPYNKLSTTIENCLMCGEPIIKRIGAKYNPKYCCMDCRNKAYILIAKLIIPKTYICEHCGKQFISKKSDKNRTPKFCSRECDSASKRMIMYCEYCGKVINNKHSGKMSGRKYCSNECRQKSRRGTNLSEEWRKALSEGRRKSEKCKGENLYNWKGGKPNTRLRVKERYYRQKGLKLKFDLSFLNRLLEVQENKCFFCETDLSEYKAIEHLTPITRGGDNHKFNLVYSCRSCNSSKHQHTLEEFALKKDRIDWLKKWEVIYANAIS